MRRILKLLGLASYQDLEEARAEIGKLTRDRDFYANMCIIDKGKVIKDAYYEMPTEYRASADAATISIGVKELTAVPKFTVEIEDMGYDK